MRELTKFQIMKLNKYIKLLVVYRRGSSRHINLKYKGSFHDPLIKKLLLDSEDKINYKSRKLPFSKYTTVSFDIPSNKVSDYIDSINKVSGLQCAQVEHITSVL